MSRRSRMLFVLALLALFATVSYATTLVPLDTRALTLQSQEIVVGTVETTRSYWNPAKTRIFTDITVRVDRRIKGGTSERLTLTQLGGVVDGVRVRVHAMPDFSPGEEALLFVARDSGGGLQVNGMAQGKFEIRKDESGARTVQRMTPGFAFKNTRSLAIVAEGEAPARISLDAMIGEIEAVIETEAGR